MNCRFNAIFLSQLWHLHRQSCLNINQKYCHLLTESHFIMSRIDSSSGLSVIPNMRWSSSRLRLLRGTLKNVTSWLLYLTMNYRVFLLWLHFGSIHTIVTYCSYSTKKWKMWGTDWSYSYHLRIHRCVICFSHGLLFGRTILYLSFLWNLHQYSCCLRWHPCPWHSAKTETSMKWTGFD